MALKKSRDAYGKVNAENISGKSLPRKGGLKDETTGKSLGSRDVKPSRSIVNHANRGLRGR